MKLISKFKDTYDYLIHMYGQDPKIVWERKTKRVAEKLPSKHRYYEEPIDDEYLQVLVINDKVFWKVVNKKGEEPNPKEVKKYKTRKRFCSIWRGSTSKKEEYIQELSTYPDKYNAPIVLVGHFVDENGYSTSGVFVNPHLSYRAGSEFDAHMRVFQNLDHQMIYEEVSTWFGRHCSEPEMVQLSDKDKLEKHGFDKKTSFRGKN